jgi:hypothetical protein
MEVSTVRSSNFFKAIKTRKDVLRKGKILMEYLSLGSGLSTSTLIILKTIGLITISNPLSISISAGCVFFAILYKLIPDSYIILKKRLQQIKDKEISHLELNELHEIQKIINDKLDVISVSATTPRTNTENSNRIPYPEITIYQN